MRPGRSSDLLILCYHAVSDRWPTELAVGVEALLRHVRYLTRRGYAPATLSEALRRPRGKTLVVSFDDAFASVAERAFPALAAEGVPATVFVPSAYVAEREPLRWASLAEWEGSGFEDELRCMSWADLRGLLAAGWEVGSHSHTHPKLTELGDAELDQELRLSRELCEDRLQVACPTFAYPFSAYDERVVERTAAAGYVAAGILDNDLAIPPLSLPAPGRPADPHRLLREGVYRGDGWPRFALKTSLAVRRMRASRLALALAARR